MKNENYCILTGIIVSNTKNADNVDIKRPIIEVEFVGLQENGETSFETIPILFSDISLSKLSSGYQVGEVLLIEGELRMGDNLGLYIEANSCSKVQEKSERNQSQAYFKTRLLQLPQCFNLVSIKGIVKDVDVVTVKRQQYTRGDLKIYDDIPISSINKNILNIGDKVICTGYITDAHLYTDSICILRNEGDNNG